MQSHPGPADRSKLAGMAVEAGDTLALTRLLRLRHPRATPNQSVTLDGKPWNQFHPAQETIELKSLTGRVSVTARS